MPINNSVTKYISTAVNIVTLITALSGMMYWADSNLANKDDIDAANLLSEFRSIELQLSFNDYRISEIEKSNTPPAIIDLETKRVYDQIIENSARLSARRDELISNGVPR